MCHLPSYSSSYHYRIFLASHHKRLASLFSALLACVHIDGAANPAPTVDWAPCDPNFVFTRFPIDCAFFEIPIDYHDPTAGTGRLSLIKVNATGERKGTLLVNPGGPGDTGVGFLALEGTTLLNTTGGNYDIVSWDPRGVGLDTIPSEVVCFSTADWLALANGTIELNGVEWSGNFTDPDDVATLLAQAPSMEEKYRQIAQSCMDATNGTTLKYIGTAANARDLVALADALDGPGSPVNYWGISYGTLLGAWFANMFPDRVGRVILDGVVSVLNMAEEESYLHWADKIADSQKVYEGFTDACALAGPSGCNLTSDGWTGQDVMNYLEEIIDAAHSAAVTDPNAPSLVVRSDFFREVIFGVLYTPSNWENTANKILARLAITVTNESGVNVSTPVEAGSRKSKRQTDLTDGMTFADAAIYCSDSVDSGSTTMTTVFEELINVTRTINPTFGALWPVDNFYCPFWPVRAVERYTGPFNKTLANKVLIIGNKADPITPFRQAQQLANIMGDGATLIQQAGFGHSSTAEHSQCVTDVIQAYLDENTLPADDNTVCGIDADEELYPGVSAREVVAKVFGGK